MQLSQGRLRHELENQQDMRVENVLDMAAD
jgi:hypothetical protein